MPCQSKCPSALRPSLESFGVSKRHASFRPKNHSTCDDWLARYESIKETSMFGGIFALIGERGTGKTQLACSILGYRYYVHNDSVFYTTVNDLVQSLIGSASGGNTTGEKLFVGNYVKPKVLVIDAFEIRKNSEFEIREINNLIDKRYGYPEKVTFLISNDTEDSLMEFLGESAISRMNETGGFLLPFVGKSFRE